MRLVTFAAGERSRAGVIASDDTVLAVAELVTGAPDDLLGLIDAGPDLLGRLREAVTGASGGAPLATTRLLAPIPRTRRNVFCIGWNYSEHFAEGLGGRGGQDEQERPPDYPSIFSKQPNTIVGPDAPIYHSAPVSDQLDWEVELAVIVGAGGRDIAEASALTHVFGYTVGNDISVRDVQRRHGGQWFKGKNFDSHLPLGPWIVTADEIPDPQTLSLETRVNGTVKQHSTTRFMVFPVARIIAELSRGMALEPGDVILTGTPEGVGFARKPPEFLQVGDVVEAEVEQIGVLRNQVVAAIERR